MRNPALLLVLAVCPLATALATEPEVREHQPTSINGYLTSGRLPKYLKVNIKGHNVRSSPDYFSGRRDNIVTETKANTLYAVVRVEPLRDGVSVTVLDAQKKERHIFLPRNRQRDFQFCESEACLVNLTEALKVLQTSGYSTQDLFSCGIALGSDGYPIDLNRPRNPEDLVAAQRPKPRTKEEAEKLVAKIPAAQQPQTKPVHSGLQVRPLWEVAGTGNGSRRWTEMLIASLRTYGKGLLNQKTLGDAQAWCPRYSKLSASEREEFWVHLLNGVARFESDFRAHPPVYDEANRINRKRGPISPHTYSMGLFMLSYGSTSQSAYRNFCHFDWRRDKNRDISDASLTIHDPKKQMNCAVGILNYLVGQDGRLGLDADTGGARFWSTLRSSNPKTKLLRRTLKRFGPCGLKTVQ